jgi:hypothetical protein
VNDLRSRLDGLPPDKRALLERKLLEMRRGGPRPDVIAPRDRTQPCPLSFPQQRLWFLDQWDPGAPTYNAALAFRLRGPLDVDVLEASVQRVVERHEALRTVFRAPGGVPVQVVLDDWSCEIRRIDAPDIDEGELLRLLREESRRPFDLASDLMLRVTLVRTGADEHVVLLGEHHIAFDGWSDDILFDDLEELYRATTEGREPALPELPIQYGDFAVWQRARAEEGALAEQVSYWQTQLAGVTSRLELPIDRERPTVQTFEGVHRPVSMPAAHAAAMGELARREAATPYMAFLALWGLALYRMTGQDDVLVGTPIANRDRVEVERLIGFFANTLVMRIRLDGNPTFRELVRRVRETALGAYAHQNVPFEKVVEAIHPERHAGYNPLFQVNFRVQSSVPAVLRVPGVTAEPFEVDVGFARFDLALELQLRPDGIGGYFEYNRALFSAETIDRIAASFADLLADAVARPDEPVLALKFPEVRRPTSTGMRGRAGRSRA